MHLTTESCLFRFLIAAFTVLIAGTTTRADDDFTKLSNQVYVQRGDKELVADVYVPPGEGPFPGVLLVHGGAWMSGNKSHMTSTAKYLANNGYSVMNINYRLAPKHKFPAQIDDCAEALRFFRKNAEKFKLDSDRVAGYGYSAGAHLVCLLGTRPDQKPKSAEQLEETAEEPEAQAKQETQPTTASTRLQAVVGGGTPCDFRSVPSRSRGLAYWLGSSRSDNPDIYEQASPMHYLSADDPAMFFFHGTTDKLVPLRGIRKMHEELRKLKITSELYEMDGMGHLGAFFSSKGMKRAVTFLDGQLGSTQDPADAPEAP